MGVFGKLKDFNASNDKQKIQMMKEKHWFDVMCDRLLEEGTVLEFIGYGCETDNLPDIIAKNDLDEIGVEVTDASELTNDDDHGSWERDKYNTEIIKVLKQITQEETFIGNIWFDGHILWKDWKKNRNVILAEIKTHIKRHVTSSIFIGSTKISFEYLPDRKDASISAHLEEKFTEEDFIRGLQSVVNKKNKKSGHGRFPCYLLIVDKSGTSFQFLPAVSKHIKLQINTGMFPYT